MSPPKSTETLARLRRRGDKAWGARQRALKKMPHHIRRADSLIGELSSLSCEAEAVGDSEAQRELNSAIIALCRVTQGNALFTRYAAANTRYLGAIQALRRAEAEKEKKELPW